MLPEPLSQHSQNQKSNPATAVFLGSRQPIMPPSGVLCADVRRLWEPGASQGGNRILLPPSCEDRASGWLRDAGGSPYVSSAVPGSVANG